MVFRSFEVHDHYKFTALADYKVNCVNSVKEKGPFPKIANQRQNNSTSIFLNWYSMCD